MTVGAIGQSFGAYPLYNISGISPAEKIDLRKSEEGKNFQAANTETVLQTEQTRPQLQDIRLDEVAEQFSDDFGYIGKDKDIHNLDVEKAVSEMQKDKVLQQYQFFVDAGEADRVLFGSEDGIVIRK